MERKRKPRISPSMGVACLALLVALTGTGVAAVQLAAPNSVGSAQVIDGSLQKRDLKPGTIPAAQKAQQGPPGPAGPSNAYTVSATGVKLSATSTPLATLKVEKGGKYVILANAYVRSSNSGGDSVRCKLAAGDSTDDTWTNLEGPIGIQVLAVSTIGNFPAGGSVVLSCVAASDKSTANQIRVTAIRVGSLDVS